MGRLRWALEGVPHEPRVTSTTPVVSPVRAHARAVGVDSHVMTRKQLGVADCSSRSLAGPE